MEIDVTATEELLSDQQNLADLESVAISLGRHAILAGIQLKKDQILIDCYFYGNCRVISKRDLWLEIKYKALEIPFSDLFSCLINSLYAD